MSILTRFQNTEQFLLTAKSQRQKKKCKGKNF